MTFTLSPELMFSLIVNVALVAAAWATLKTKVEGLAAKAKDHDNLSTSLTELRVDVRHLQETLKAQPAATATVVSAAIKEVLAAMPLRSVAMAG
jgi:hypothetical protein